MSRQKALELMNVIRSLPLTTNNYPMRLESDFQWAITFKREADYDLSFDAYIELFEKEGVVYTGILNGAFKTMAVAGYLNYAIELLKMGDDAMRQSGFYINNFSEHLIKLKNASQSRTSLFNYLKSISGNPVYYLPNDIDWI